MFFNLTYGCYSLFVEIPRDSDNCTNFEFEKMPFPPIPFYTSSEGTWDMSEKEASNNVKQSITLNFETMTDCPDNIE